jgi:hypothetical protein
VHRNAGPDLDDELTRLVMDSSGPAGDPLRPLLGSMASPVRNLDLHHWLGLLGLVAAIAVTAFVVPPLVIPVESSAPSATAPLSHTWLPSVLPSSTPVIQLPPVAPSGTLTTAPTAASTTGRDSRLPRTGTRKVEPQTPQATTGESLPASTKATKKATSITMQAESGSLSEGAAVVACGTCESGARVRYLGRVDVHPTIPSAGTYEITVTYEVDGVRQLAVSINDRPPISTRTVAGSSWTTPLKMTFKTALPAGPVDIGLHADDGNAPDIDAVTIS